MLFYKEIIGAFAGQWLEIVDNNPTKTALQYKIRSGN